MARIPPLRLEDAEPTVRTALERLPQLAIFATVANAQGSFVNWLRFGGDCLNPELFDPVLRELAILRVARMTPGAGYEWAQHVPILLAVGGTEEQVSALEADELEAPALGEDGRLVVRFTSQVVRECSPDEQTYAAMSERFTNNQIVQLLLVIGQYMMVGRIMATAQLEVDAVLGGDVLEGVAQAQARRRGANALAERKAEE
jgi:alkylhydroperoxidase family enzyme